MRNALFALPLLLLAFDLSAATTDVRIMAANTSSGNYQSYPNPGPGVRIFQGLDPDIVLIQEFNVNETSGGDNSATAVDAWVLSAFGPSFEWYRETGAQIPNGVISRYPILNAGTWQDSDSPNREFVWAQIDVPGDVDLWAVSVHFLTANSSTRNSEAQQLVSYINANVPSGDFLVVGGDFNTDSRGESCVSTLGQLTVTSSPYPEGQSGDDGTNASRSKPYDWVLADSDLDAKEIPVEVGSSSFPAGLVFDSRDFTPLSAVSPVQFGDSDAPQMQHMAVIRDFRLDGGIDPPPPPPPTGGGEPLDISGYSIEQSNSSVTLVFPQGTEIPPNGTIVIGRDTSQATLEATYGDFQDNAVFLSGMALAGGNGFPVINGDEVYRLLDNDGTPVDPGSGTLPDPAMSTGISRYRTSVNSTAMDARPNASADPGHYTGEISHTGRLVITEITDSASFQQEFIELYYDAVIFFEGHAVVFE